MSLESLQLDFRRAFKKKKKIFHFHDSINEWEDVVKSSSKINNKTRVEKGSAGNR